MRKIEAIIKPARFEEVLDALHGVGITGLTANEVRGYGRQHGHTELFRGSEYTTNMVPKIRIDVVVREAQVEAVVAAIREAAHTGEVGDGKIFVLPVENTVRIRTGETGADAV